MEVLEGAHDAHNSQFGIVVSKFNELVTSRLLEGALQALRQRGASDQQIHVVRVPGAFEIPLVARHLAKTGRFNAIICLGAVIRGETAHFDYICTQASQGIAQAALDTGVPVIFGVLTTNTVEQALERAGTPERNRGAHAAQAAIEMATLMNRVKSLEG